MSWTRAIPPEDLNKAGSWENISVLNGISLTLEMSGLQGEFAGNCTGLHTSREFLDLCVSCFLSWLMPYIRGISHFCFDVEETELLV